jgi:hypoxanthine phosphoribosyltransferase
VKIVEWNEYVELLSKLFQDMKLRSFDGIATIGRGGCIIGAYLASKLGIPTIDPIFIRHVGRAKEMKIVANDIGKARTLSGRILLVDDWLCDGRAMRYVLNLIPKTATITTLVMFNRSGSEFKPDVVGRYVDEEERDIHFPYDPV